MKLISLVFVLLMALPLFATEKVVSVVGRGEARGTCNSSGGASCISQLASEASDQAYQDADQSCSAQEGELREAPSSCYANCSPNHIPPNTGSLVICNSRCSLSCYIGEK